MFVYVGRNITQSNDPLIKMSIVELMRRIQNPKIDFQNSIKQLRIANTIDSNKYKELKKSLPYFTCGVFHPLFRKKENFASISNFVLDLDHLSQNEVNIDVLIDQLKRDMNVLAYFVSPGGDGLKVLFHLKNNCTDAILFSAFYKVFTMKFAQKYNLQKVVDLKTSDVSRACFISWDEGAIINTESNDVDMNEYLSDRDFEVSELVIKEAVQFAKDIKSEENKPNQDISDDILEKIKQKLNPTFKLKNEKDVYVPSEIEELLPIIEKHLNAIDIILVETYPINYGKKIKVKAGIFWAEINLFYGKKGYSIVKTPKNGSNEKLADLAFQSISQIIYT
jgi:hypothetical protein